MFRPLSSLETTGGGLGVGLEFLELLLVVLLEVFTGVVGFDLAPTEPDLE